jgi:peptidoglycan/xylan/chitin deacetylase (PgdA/CDA1 family)
MPQDCARGKVDPDVTEQYVLISFDGCVDIESWRAWAKFCDKHPRLRLTFFVSGTCFLTDEQRNLYQGPGSEPGKARIRFGGTQPELLERVACMNALFLSGHEIASHAVGHLDGTSWSPAEWLAEFRTYDRLIENFAGNNGLDAGQGLAFGPDDIKGFRAPFLSIGPGLDEALAAREYRYDASMAGRAGDWPRKNQDGIWKFKLASIPLRGYRRAPLSMDYNLFIVQSQENPEVFDDFECLEERVVEAYLQYFKRNYLTDRAPIHIGHHFTDYRGLVYRKALMRFIESIMDRPDVTFCTYAQLSDDLDRIGSPPHGAVVREAALLKAGR